jgi:hypothetical protein
LKLSKRLTTGLSKEEAKEFSSQFASFQPQLRRIRELLELELTVNNARRIKDDYTLPSWAMQQADSNGFERAIKLIQDLLDVRS